MKLSIMSINCQHIMSSKINKIQIVWMVVCLLCLTTLFSCWLWIALKEQQKILYSESLYYFKQAIQDEKKKQLELRVGFYDPKFSPNDISEEEKNEWCNQDFLTHRDPGRSVLDSLFQISLMENKIKAQVAIRYICNGKIIDSNTNSLLYNDVYALEPIVYRKDAIEANNIILQAYVKFPFKTVLLRSPLLIIIFCLWLISLAGIVCYYYLVRCKKKQEPATLTIPISTVPLLTEQAIVWTELPCGLLFDEKYGDLQYKGQVCAQLRDNNLRLFRCFLKTEEHKLTIEDICIEVLNRNINEGLTESDRSAVSSAIYRFRITLKSIPVIKIETIRATGFRMIFGRTQLFG